MLTGTTPAEGCVLPQFVCLAYSSVLISQLLIFAITPGDDWLLPQCLGIHYSFCASTYDNVFWLVPLGSLTP